MSSAIITLLGFYNYDPTLFENLDLPTGIDNSLLIDSILMRGGEYEVIYSNPNLLKSMIGSWSTKWKPVFANWLRATQDMDDIRPLDNYDRIETWTDASESHSTNVMHGTGSTTGTDSTTAGATASGTDTVSAYDSSSLVNDTGTSQTNSSNSSSNTSTSSATDTTSGADTTGSSTHNAHVYGNIGVTTSAQMFREFYDIMGRYGNFYESIATVFLQAFVIPIL